MKCDRCNKPAVVHEVTVRNGIKKEIHLCEEHARQAGVAMPGNQPINEVLTQFVISKSPSAKPARTTLECETCGLKLSSFRRSGILGCSDCYDTFVDHLAPLIERAQNGASSHVGKSPQRSEQAIDRQLLMRRLVKELETAVASEQYERACELRDQLQQLKSETTGPTSDHG